MQAGVRVVAEFDALGLGQLLDLVEQGVEHAGVADGQRAVLAAGRELVVDVERHAGMGVDHVRAVAVAVGGVLEAFLAQLVVQQVPVADVLELVALLEHAGQGQVGGDFAILVELAPVAARELVPGFRRRQILHRRESLVGRGRGQEVVRGIGRRVVRGDVVEVEVARTQVEQLVAGHVEGDGILLQPEQLDGLGHYAMSGGEAAVRIRRALPGCWSQNE